MISSEALHTIYDVLFDHIAGRKQAMTMYREDPAALLSDSESQADDIADVRVALAEVEAELRARGEMWDAGEEPP
jgi:hypothetical protein